MIRVGPNRQLMLSSIDRMGVGDMPDFDPGMKKAAVALARLTDAANKHMIIISDGDPTPPTPGPEGGRRRPVDVPAIGVARPRQPATLASFLATAPPASRFLIQLVDLDDDGELDVIWQSLGPRYEWGIVLSRK